MNLTDYLPKNLPFLKKKTAEEYFFALNIFEDTVEAIVWGIVGDKLHIINTATQKYSSHEDIIESANYALDEALADFQPEPVKILFGVPDHFLQDEELKPESLRLLRKMVKELGVEPLAFVSMTHAVSHLLQKQQGVPVTGILVEVSDPLTVAVIKAGKVLGIKRQKRTNNLPEDIEKALLSFTDIEVMPSKIMLYGDGEVSKHKENLVSFPWMSQLPFLHLPKIENLGADITMKAICFAGGSEINPDISFARGPHPSPEHAVSNHSKLRPLEKNPSRHDDLDSAGFVKGDIHDRLPVPVRGVEDEDLERVPVAAASDQTIVERIKTLPAMLLAFLPVGNLSKRGLPFANSGLLVLILPVLLLVGLIAAYVFIPHAKVTVFVDLRTLEKDSTVTADPSATAVDEEKKIIPGKVVSASVDGSSKGQATGKKKIGDPAKGTVIVYNKTSGPKTFAQGTVLVGANNLRFTLDTSVNVASQSAVDGGISFGKATVNATAVDIGPEGNLAAGKELSIKDQSTDSFSAKVDQAFSGGISKEVTVVTLDDQKRLLATLTADLRKKARDQMQSELEEGMKIIEESLIEELGKKTYSKNVGDQAAEFSLAVTANYKGTAYNESDLKTMVSKLVETTVPDGYELDLSQTETQANVAKVEKDGTLVFTAKFKAKLMPKIDKDKLKKDISGKSVEQAAERLKQIENVIGSNIEVTPALPGPLQRLPLLPGNITLDITAK